MILLGQSCYRQTDPHPRSRILLSVRICGRYSGGCRYCTLLSTNVQVRLNPSLKKHVTSSRGLVSQQSGAPPPVHTAATLFQKLCYENKDGLSAGIIVAGWDKEVGPSVYNIPLGGGLFRQPWAIGGAFPRLEFKSTN